MANIKSHHSYKVSEATKTVTHPTTYNVPGGVDTIERILVLRSDGCVLKTSRQLSNAYCETHGETLSPYEKRRRGFVLAGSIVPAGTPARDVAKVAIALFRRYCETHGYRLSETV